MSNDTLRATKPRALGLLAAVLAVGAVLALAACGGSTATGAKNASASTSTPASGKDRRAALRECLEKQGVKLPSAPSGGAQQGSPPTGGGSGFTPPAGGAPSGTSQSKLQEAFRKCGGGSFPGGARPGNSSAFKASLTKFAQCMRENGVSLPAPNTSGKGPVFDTKGIDTSSSSFKSAQSKCRSQLKGGFGAGGPPPGQQAGPPGEASSG